jgi:membrane associated rhomboid family serine protease
MSIFDRLERRMGWVAVPGLVRYIAMFQVLVFVLMRSRPDFGSMLTLELDKVLSGQVWRLFTFLFVPSAGSLFWFVFAAMFLLFMAEALEGMLGPFRLTCYVLLFLVTQWLGLLLFDWLPGVGLLAPSLFISNLFFALAAMAPRTEIRLYFVVPVQIRWIALLDLLLIVYTCVRAPVLFPVMLWGLLPFLLMFVPGWIRDVRQRAKSGARRAEFKAQSLPEEEAFHSCKVCGRTDRGNPELEFRIAGDGEEYCGEHQPK